MNTATIPIRRHSSMLRHRSDWRTLGLLIALTTGFGVLLAGATEIAVLPCLVLTITACAAKHNHTHRAVFTRRWANRALDLWLTVLTGSSTTGIRVAHQVRHHGRNQSEADFVRCSVVSGLPPGAALLRYVPAVIVQVWRDGRQDLAGVCRKPLRRALVEERVVLWGFIAMSLWSSGTAGMVAIAACWLAAQWFLIAINLPQHDGCDPRSRWRHSRNVTGHLANWIFLNNGYHTAHHEWPARHWSELPALHARHVAPELGPGELAPSLAAFWTGWWKRRAASTSPEP